MKIYKVHLMSILFALLFVFCFFSCSVTAPEKDIKGLPWDSMAETTWYIMQSNGHTMERWRFYKDSLVVDEDHFGDDTIATYRSRTIGKVCTKDTKEAYWVNSKEVIFQCTELQWKKMTPSLTNYSTWTYVYDWSVYQLWSIESKLVGLACVGETPDCWELSIEPLIKIKYPNEWIYDKMQ